METVMTTPKGECSAPRSKKTTTLAMPEIFPNLTQDLITEILVRLPVKSIGRFKCVSKPCRSFLSSPQFVKSHLMFNIDDSDGLICAGGYTNPNHSSLFTLTLGSTSDGEDDGFCREVNLPFLKSAHFWVKGSYHGLVLLQLLNNSDRSDPLIVVNPITLEYVNVPECPNATWCTYGLGYDSSKDDYKVISLPRLKDLGGRFVYIYSLKTKNWKKVGNIPPGKKGTSYINIFDTSCGVFVNGRMHWMDSDTKIANSHHCVLDAFNLTNENFEEIPLPSGVELDNEGACPIRFLGGCLALIQSLDTYHMDVWLMKEYGVQDSWTKLTIICPEAGDIWDVVCLFSEDEIIIENVDRQLIAYNWRTRVSRNMVVAGFPVCCIRFLNFRGSLVSPSY